MAATSLLSGVLSEKFMKSSENCRTIEFRGEVSEYQTDEPFTSRPPSDLVQGNRRCFQIWPVKIGLLNKVMSDVVITRLDHQKFSRPR
jgi:hypothetical protein